jgi:hypothetical protein
MRNTIKTLLAILTSVALISSVNAGEVSVTGTAKATYSKVSGSVNGNGSIGITNELAFNASGELDNGFTWKWQIEHDPDTGATSNVQTDDQRMEIVMGDMGTIGIYVSEGSLSTKYGWDASAYTSITDTGFSEGMTYPKNISDYNNIQYHTPTLPFSTVLKVGYGADKSTEASSGNASNVSQGDTMNSYQVTTSPVDGLTIGASYSDINLYGDDVLGDEQAEESGAYYAKYKTGAFTIGAGKQFYAPAVLDGAQDTSSGADQFGAAVVEYYKNTSYSAAYALNDEVTLSYTNEKGERSMMTSATATDDIKVKSIQVAYNLGGATLSLARTDTSNVGYTDSVDATENLFAVAMAF